MKYVSGWSVWGIYTSLSWSGEVAEPIGSIVPAPYGAGTILPIGSATSPLQLNEV